MQGCLRALQTCKNTPALADRKKAPNRGSGRWGVKASEIGLFPFQASREVVADFLPPVKLSEVDLGH
jgi:hypothetical protein